MRYLERKVRLNFGDSLHEVGYHRHQQHANRVHIVEEC